MQTVSDEKQNCSLLVFALFPHKSQFEGKLSKIQARVVTKGFRSPDNLLTAFI